MDLILHLDGAGGGSNSGPGEPDPVQGCGSGNAQNRLNTASLMFKAELAQALTGGAIQGGIWTASHSAGNTYDVTWPDGTTGSYYISGPHLSVPLTAEVSCE